MYSSRNAMLYYKKNFGFQVALCYGNNDCTEGCSFGWKSYEINQKGHNNGNF